MRHPRFRLRSPAAALRDRRGLAAIELALVAPVLLLMLFSITDLCLWQWRTTRLEIAARAGAQYALARPQDEAGISSTVLGQLQGWANVTVATPRMSCKCDNGAAVDCTTGTCPNGAVVHAPIGYISITVTQPFQTISPLTTYLFPNNPTLRGNVEMRLH